VQEKIWAEIQEILSSHQIPYQWPRAVLDQEKKISFKEKEIQKRRDLRNLPFITIDGEDAKDFDDAVYCAKENSGWSLFVAIADVSHYVTKNSAIDEEALKRGTSIYLPGRVIPMLPEKISNNLCSLLPNKDRLAMICEMSIDENGKMASYSFYPGVIRSQARLTYTQANEIITGNKIAEKKYSAFVEDIQNLHRLYTKLKGLKDKRGAIEFNSKEIKFVFNQKEEITDIQSTERNDAHCIIEECMILANISAASFIRNNKIPGLYRIHDLPTQEKLDELKNFLEDFGLSLRTAKKPTSKNYAKLLKKIKNEDKQSLIQIIMLRSLPQAEYNYKNIGHFGLSLENYTHFTSPIRRYPDLITHRIIKNALGKNRARKHLYLLDDVSFLGAHCSDTERKAEEAARDIQDFFKCLYMQDKIGKTFKGVISTVTSFGIFVEIENIFVSGLVHIKQLKKDYYHFEPDNHRLYGEHTGHIYQIGEKVKIKLAAVNINEGKIDFHIAK